MSKEVIETAKQVASDTAVQSKLVEMLDSLQHGAIKVGEEVVKYSPDIADTALWVVRIDGAQQIVSGLMALAVAICAAKWLGVLWKWGREKAEDECDGIYYIWPTFATAAMIIPVVFCAEKLLSVWHWIAIFQPKLWLAKQIISATLK